MIVRDIEPHLRLLATEMPAIAVTGPRQSGKTTLCRAAFPDHAYVSLEPLDIREFALSDPRGFLDQYRAPVILDEVQRAPDLFSYLQGAIDRDATPGRYVLTGSQHFGLSESLNQSLAGRVGLLHLLPLSQTEIRRFDHEPADLWTTVWTGGYPRIHDRGLDAGRWLADYAATYVQRDVRQVLNVSNLDAFAAFLSLAAGRTAQELNLSTLGGDVGVSYNTIRSWMSVLETSFVVHRLPPWHRNLRKRTVKAAKVHFVDSGLACHLLAIRDPDQLRTHPLRGAIFETWVTSEILKARFNAGRSADLYHLRQPRGLEVDVIVDRGLRVSAVEVKSGATVASDFLKGLKRFRGDEQHRARPSELDLRLVFGGEEGQMREGIHVVPWHEVGSLEW